MTKETETYFQREERQKQERKAAFAALTVGSEAYFHVTGRGFSVRSLFKRGTVTKITPTGQVVVTVESGVTYRFKAGDLIGGSEYGHIVTQAEYAAGTVKQNFETAAANVRVRAEKVAEAARLVSQKAISASEPINAADVAELRDLIAKLSEGLDMITKKED